MSFAIFILWTIFLWVSCDSKKKDCINHIYLPDSMHQFVYLTGSFWIYQNDSTGVYDSTNIRHLI
jgi:hypothetical protein